MADPTTPDPHSGQTLELSVLELRRALAADGGGSLTDQLPGLEPERRVDDWGRSERVEAVVDRLVYDFLYRYWFRVEVEGIEHVPGRGGALLLANHGGTLPPDAAMITKAIRQEHPQPRPVHLITDGRLRTTPALGMLLTKLGAVSGHPSDLQRLLGEEERLVLAFPEGSAARRKPLRERYRLRRFAAGSPVAAALQAQVPIVPAAVLGAEEAAPVLGRLGGPLGRIVGHRRSGPLSRLSRMPITPGVPLPAKLRIRFLEPIRTHRFGEHAWRDESFVQALAHDVRSLIQENLLEMVAARRNVWLG